MLRFYDPEQGSITLDGVDIRELNVRWLRAQVGFVGQEPVLFSGSVQKNIAHGRVDTSKQQYLTLEDAMHIAAEEESRISQDTGGDSCPIPCLDHCCGGKKQKSPRYESLHGQAASDSADVESGHTAGVRMKEVDDDVVSAAMAANAHDFIETFPKRYDTDIGEKSIMISGRPDIYDVYIWV